MTSDPRPVDHLRAAELLAEHLSDGFELTPSETMRLAELHLGIEAGEREKSLHDIKLATALAYTIPMLFPWDYGPGMVEGQLVEAVRNEGVIRNRQEATLEEIATLLGIHPQFPHDPPKEQA